LGTTFSAFWIMVNNSWMQVPSGYVMENGAFVPNDWNKIIFNSVVWSRFPHMLFASYLKRRETGWRSAVRMAGRGEPAQPVRD
jgi:cytochrome bd-type quinol oxidase subunit 1